MKRRTTRGIGYAIAVIMVMAIILTAGLVFTASANESDGDMAVLNTRNYSKYEFSEAGYSIDENVTSHTGSYMLCGEANMDVCFTSSNGEPVTYNVILHDWKAMADEWFALLNVDKNVTLNITAYGVNVIQGYNHPGIKWSGNGTGEAPVVNINLAENSSLIVASNYTDEDHCVGDEVKVNLGEGVVASLDMTNDDWKKSTSIIFSKGTAVAHKNVYTYVDDRSCQLTCDSCSLINTIVPHAEDEYLLEKNDENYETKHAFGCKNCKHNAVLEDHSIFYQIYEDVHRACCNSCDYNEEFAHTIENDGCTVCEEKYIASIELGGVTTKYLTFDKLKEAVAESGGRVTLLRDIRSSFGDTLTLVKADATIDLAGFKLIGVGVEVRAGQKLTVTDTSANKSGVWELYWKNALIYGELVLEDITIKDFVSSVFNVGVLKIENACFKNSVSITVGDEGSVEIKNATAIDDDISFYAKKISETDIAILGGSYKKITVTSDNSEECNVNMILPDGYAYSGEGGILIGSKREISDVTAIVAHPEHNCDTLDSNDAEHWASCVCGYVSEGVTKELHSVDENAVCPVCDSEIEASVIDATSTIRYFATVEAAFEFAENLSFAEVRLLRDAESDNDINIRTDVRLELNGYKLYASRGRIYVYNSLLVTDTSQTGTGTLSSKGGSGYIIEIRGNGVLDVNSGEIIGLIYASSSSGQKPIIDISGGRFTGEETFRLSQETELTISGGVFECSDGVFNMGWNADFTLKITGGKFVNSTIFYAYFISDLPNLEDVFPAMTGCGFAFLAEDGTRLTIDDVSKYYEGTVVVAHINSELKKDETHHWFDCTVCTQSWFDMLDHTAKYIASTEDGTLHLIECKFCAQTMGSEAHSGGDANCTQRAMCERCGTAYGETEPNDHIGGTATCTEKAVCERCEQSYGELNPENHSSAETKYELSAENDGDHVKFHVCCNGVAELGKHEGGTPTCTDKAVCVVCGIAYGAEPQGHSYKNDCDTDCDTCGAARQISHKYGKNGQCTVCGADAPKDKGLGAGAIVGIVSGSLAVCGGGFALGWFVIRKKFKKSP